MILPFTNFIFFFHVCLLFTSPSVLLDGRQDGPQRQREVGQRQQAERQNELLPLVRHRRVSQGIPRGAPTRCKNNVMKFKTLKKSYFCIFYFATLFCSREQLRTHTTGGYSIKETWSHYNSPPDGEILCTDFTSPPGGDSSIEAPH